ncbi:MAG: transcription initiation factor IIB [Candidatus Lokiarchaeota archaeon]|nr:transcription initiation factor IIB [Candidatus Lokiarchaeota archaeon]MBD3201374.1 transcription initiation factor IIB [Candidatus Lokiarchaeota archaeon]
MLSHDNSNLCPECGNSNLILDESRAELICYDCGLVITQKIIDSGPEWRSFSAEDTNKKARVGAPSTLTLHDKGLSTIIGWKNIDAYGNKITPKKKAEVYRLRKWHLRSRTNKSIDRNLAYAMNELDRIASQLNLSRDIKESSAHIYRKMANKNLIRGRSIEGMLIASIYLSCRLNKIPKTLDDFIEFSSVEKKNIARCYRLIIRELKLNIHVSSPIRFIPRFCAELELSGKTQNRAAELLKLAKKYRLTAGKAPTGLAGAALYLAAIQEGERRTQKQISKTTGVTEATIRNRYKELVDNLSFDVNV